jgi:hypothetical protein
MERIRKLQDIAKNLPNCFSASDLWREANKNNLKISLTMIWSYVKTGDIKVRPIYSTPQGDGKKAVILYKAK